MLINGLFPVGCSSQTLLNMLSRDDYKLIADNFYLNKIQIDFADRLLKSLDSTKTQDEISFQSSLDRAEKVMSKSDASSCMQVLAEELELIEVSDSGGHIALTSQGSALFAKYKSFPDYLLAELHQKYDATIEPVMAKPLYGMPAQVNIFQVKNWWLICLLNSIVSFAIAWVLIKYMG